MPSRPRPATVTRRQFLAVGAALPLILGGSEVAVVAESYLGQIGAMRRAALPNDEWLADNAARVHGLSLGTSFAPEQWSGGERRDGRPMAALQFAVDELGMRDIRLGFRWSRVDRGDGPVDLRAYLPYLRFCLDRGVNLALNLGPIKVFRWPENHVPGYVRERRLVPATRGTVTTDSDLGKAALDYLERLLASLDKELGAGTLAGVSTIQAENEPFYPLGDDRWSLSDSYLVAVTSRLARHFPSSRLLVSSAGRLNLASAQAHFRRLLAADDSLRDRLVLGFDYHFQTPFRDHLPVLRHFDPITFANPWTQTPAENRSLARQMGYAIEVTEGQAEPNGYLREPGSSARLYRFMLQRCMDEVLLPEAPSLIRVWGVEELAKAVLAGEATVEHRQIVDLTRRVNEQSRSAPALIRA